MRRRGAARARTRARVGERAPARLTPFAAPHLCSLRSPLFYMRKKVAKDLTELTEGLSRFGW